MSSSSRAEIEIASYPYKVGEVARSRVPFIHNGLDGDKNFDRAWVRRERLEAAAVLPLCRDGRLVGVTAQFFRRRLESKDIGELQAVAAISEQVLAQAVGLRRSAK